MKKFLLRLICLNLISLLGIGVLEAYDTGQQVFNPLVRSLSVYNPDNFMAPPVIRKGTSDKLIVNFDIIGDSHDYLRYRLVHCNADWQPSRLLESEFLDGFNEFEIDDYAYSSNTYIHYVNYRISNPDPSIKYLASGNYLLQVFPENEPEMLLLQARFSVSEEKTFIDGGLTTHTDRGRDSDYQQLFFEIELAPLGNINPYQDLLITVTQNNDPNSMRLLSHPLRVDRGKAIFEHAPELIFEAGNEFRRFETVRTDYPGMHVDSVKFKDGMQRAWLQTDLSRKDREYSFDRTQHGRFKIDEYNSSDPDLSADYILVNFSLDPGERQNGEIYVDGDFTSHQLSEEFLMRYDWSSGLYHLELPLKQGSYNYRYVTVTPKGTPSSAPIEGNKYETSNEYLVNVFLRTPGSRAERLVSSSLITN